MVATTCQVKPSQPDEKMNRRITEQGTAEYRNKKHFPGTKSQVSGVIQLPGVRFQVSGKRNIEAET